MSTAPAPKEIFERAIEEGERRLNQSLLELAATSFIAGFTIVFGIAALGIVHTVVEPVFGEIARIVGALAFAIGVVFLVVGRAELFNENFFDPVAKTVDESHTSLVPSLLRLWVVTYALNLVGGVLFVSIFAVDGVFPPGTAETMRSMAEDFSHRPNSTIFASAIVGGTLVSLLSFMLHGVDTVGSRITVAYVTGFLLALGPFDHVVVTVLHIVFGMMTGATISYSALVEIVVVATTGNLVGGLGLVTFTHVAQVMGVRD
jgi:formate/nitrite transporter FocA (FNT family)